MNRNGRTVIGSISLSLDGRVTGPGGDYDMGWIVPYAGTDAARDRMVGVTSPATTVLLGRKNYLGFGGYWPTVARCRNSLLLFVRCRKGSASKMNSDEKI